MTVLHRSSDENDTIRVASRVSPSRIERPPADVDAPGTNGTNHSNIGPQSLANQLAISQNISAVPQNTFAGALPSVSTFSGETQELLKRLNANATLNPSAGQDAYQAAREQVLKNMITHRDMPTPPPPATRGRGRGRGRPPKLHTAMNIIARGTSTNTPISTERASKSRGRGRGRGKRSGRGGKRKRGDNSDDDSEVSNSYTPLPTQTKSGRSINKPMQYNPAPESSPSYAMKRTRGPNRKGLEYTLCSKCQRGHSPESNQIVYCDGCNTPYHQWCHDPIIPREVVEVAEKEWFCSNCPGIIQLTSSMKPEDWVSGHGLSTEEKETYLSSLSSSRLVSLLMHSLKMHPNLAIFAPNTRELLQTAHPAMNATIPTPPGTEESTSLYSQLQPQPQQQPPPPPPTSIPSSAPTTIPGVPSSDSSPEPPLRFHPTTSNITVNAKAAAEVLATADPPATYPPALHGPYRIPQTLTQAQHQNGNHIPFTPPTQETQPSAAQAQTQAQTQPDANVNANANANAPASPHPAPSPAMHDDDEELPWLIDDNFEVFSHLYNDGSGALVPTERHEAWLRDRGANGSGPP